MYLIKHYNEYGMKYLEAVSSNKKLPSIIKTLNPNHRLNIIRLSEIVKGVYGTNRD